MKKAIKIHSSDNVAVAIETINISDEILINNKSVIAVNCIKPGHKIAIQEIRLNEEVIKYGASIGHAIQQINVGEHVHTHNTKTNLSDNLKYTYLPKFNPLNIPKSNKTFLGYKRKNGDVGIRNELWIIPSVGCVNGQAEMAIKLFKEAFPSPNIDGIHVFKHNYGCSQLGDDHENTRTALIDMMKHPNCGGVLVFGLGCENNQISDIKKFIGKYDHQRVKFLVAQEVKNEVEEGFKLVKELYEMMKKDKREVCSLSSLKIGLKCGGSDGFSGITANPLLGAFSDFLISQGGTTVLTEVPEMFGAELLLMQRAENESVFNKIVSLINGFKGYFRKHKQPIYENPSPGNKEGGITTLEDKSLGCTQKGGTANVTDVLKYGQIIEKKGLNLLYAPGNDLVATSSLGFSGCQMVLFTTGRGTPFGSFIPTVKISTNSPLAKSKPHWVDFNAGELIEGKGFEEITEKLIDYVLKIASGKLVLHEKNNFKEIAIFKTGVTL